MVAAEAVPVAPSVVVEAQPVVVVTGQPVMQVPGMPDYTKGASVLKAVPHGGATKFKKAWAVVDQNGQLLGYIRVRLTTKHENSATGDAVKAGACCWFLAGGLVGVAAHAVMKAKYTMKFPDYGIQFYPVDNMVKPALDCQVSQNAMGMSEWSYLDREGAIFAREASRAVSGVGERAEVAERWVEVDCKASGTAVPVAISGQVSQGPRSDSRAWTVPGRPDLPLGVLELSNGKQQQVGQFELMEGAGYMNAEARNCLLCQLMTRLAGGACSRLRR